MIAVLAVAAGVIWIIWIYLERSKPDRIKKVQKDSELDKETEAYNTVMSAKSIIRVMGEKGHQTDRAEMIIERAELALDAGNHLRAEELAEDAKTAIKKVLTKKAPSPKTTDSDLKLPPTPPVKEQEQVKKFKEQKERIEKLPENYLEAKFEIEVARDLCKERGHKEAKRLLSLAEKHYSEGDYTEALRYAVKTKREIDEEEAGLLAGQKIGRKKRVSEEEEFSPVSMVKDMEEDLQQKTTIIECPECGNELGEDDRFCNMCGAKAPEIGKCPECDAEVDSGDRFCSKCGTELGMTVYECPECGRELEDEVSFCPGCGTAFE